MLRGFNENMIMIKKEIALNIALIFGGLLLLNFYSSLMIDLRDAAAKLDVHLMYILHVSAMIICFAFGVLLEWKRVKLVFAKKVSIKLNSILLIGIILFVIGLLPPMFYVKEIGALYLPFPKGGFGVNLFFGALNQTSNVHSILSVAAGTLFVKGLSQT